MYRTRLCVAVAAVAAVAGIVSCSDDNGPAGPVLEVYNVTLTGANERPNPVTTTATATATVTIMGSDSIELVLRLQGIDSVTASHFHAADETVSGPIMFGIFAGPATGLQYTGQLAHAFIQRGTGGFTGIFTYDSLLARIRAGTTYLNVHTRRNPGGEIRGQVKK